MGYSTMLIESGTIPAGELGEAVIQAARDRQLTRSEIIQLCNYEGFPQPFLNLCLDVLLHGARSQAA
jgi:hypothetical protein